MDLYTLRNMITSGINILDIPLKVTFYARVSTDKDSQLNSLTNQIEYFGEFIKKNNKWEYIDGYIDEGISGTRVSKRDSFLKMIEDAKESKFDLILTKEISRFSRNTLDSIKYTQELLFSNVGVWFLNDNINTFMPDSELRLTIMSSIAQDEVRKLSDRISFGMKRSIAKGNVLGNSKVYGFKKDKGKLILDMYEVNMVKLIYKEYANTSISLNGLSKLLERRGYLSSNNKRIDPTVIKRLIENPKYKGYYCGNKTRVIDYRSKKKKHLDKKEWIIYKDELIPQLVSEQLWNKANDKLMKIRSSYANRIKDKCIFENRYTYSGKIFCSEHNYTYHRNGSGKRTNNPVWECSEYRRNGISGCTNIRLNERNLDLFFKNLIDKIFCHNMSIIDGLIGEYVESNKCYTYKVGSTNIDNEIKVIKEKKDKILDLMLNSSISKEELIRKDDELNKKITALTEKKSHTDRDYKSYKSTVETKLYDFELYKKIISTILDKIVVSSDNITFIFKTKEKFIINHNAFKEYLLRS